MSNGNGKRVTMVSLDKKLAILCTNFETITTQVKDLDEKVDALRISEAQRVGEAKASKRAAGLISFVVSTAIAMGGLILTVLVG